MDALIPMGAAPEQPLRKKAKAQEDDDDDDDIDTEKVLEKTAVELQKEFENAEFTEGANEVGITGLFLLPISL